MDPFSLAAIIGGGASALGGLLSSSAPQQKYKTKTFPTLLPEAMQAVRGAASGFGQTLPAGLQYLQSILGNDPDAFETFQAPYMRMFQEQVIPQIAERFSGLGAGAQSSSAFQQALGQAGAGLTEQLASLHQGMKSGALSQLLGLGKLSTTPAFSTGLFPGKRSSRDILGESLGGLGSSILGGALERMPLT